MLAAQLPTAVDYIVLPTVVSLFICVLVVGLAIFTASAQPRTVRSLAIAAFAMGVGIASMHYVGMRAIHASVHMSHAASFVVASVVVAIAASALAIWLAFGATRRPPLLICATVLGLAISGMHYTAMAGCHCIPIRRRRDRRLRRSRSRRNCLRLSLLSWRSSCPVCSC